MYIKMYINMTPSLIGSVCLLIVIILNIENINCGLVNSKGDIIGIISFILFIVGFVTTLTGLLASIKPL